MGYKNIYIKRERFRERELQKQRDPLGYKNKERDKVTKTKREILATGYKMGYKITLLFLLSFYHIEDIELKNLCDNLHYPMLQLIYRKHVDRQGPMLHIRRRLFGYKNSFSHLL